MRVTRCLIATIGLLVVLPMLANAAVGPAARNTMSVGQITAAAAGDNAGARRVTVPISIENKDALVAMDIPLTWDRNGVQLVNVAYSDRVNYFDEKITNIDNDNRNVVMGLISMAYDPTKSDLATGKGEVAYLTFEVTDPTVSEFVLSAAHIQKPSHRLMLVYHEYDAAGRPEVKWDEPYFDPITVPVMAKATPLVPTSFALNQNYPNPFNAGTIIGFDLPEDSDVRVSIYNVLGQTVRTFSGQYEAGQRSVTWDGTDENSNGVSSGVYFYRIAAKNFNDVKKMTLLK
jgi:hypothetical protein